MGVGVLGWVFLVGCVFSSLGCFFGVLGGWSLLFRFFPLCFRIR